MSSAETLDKDHRGERHLHNISVACDTSRKDAYYVSLVVMEDGNPTHFHGKLSRSDPPFRVLLAVMDMVMHHCENE